MQERLQSIAAAAGDAATAMATGGALALLSLPPTPPGEDARPAAMRARRTGTGGPRRISSSSATAAAPLESQAAASAVNNGLEANSLSTAVFAAGRHESGRAPQKALRQGSGVGRATALAAVLSLCLCAVSAWWLAAGVAGAMTL